MKAVHSINTTVSSLHGVTPMEVVLGRPVNEKSVLIAARKERKAQDTKEHHPSRPIGKEGGSLPNSIENIEQSTKQPEQSTANDSEVDSRKVLGRTIHKVIRRGQQRQIRSYRKK